MLRICIQFLCYMRNLLPTFSKHTRSNITLVYLPTQYDWMRPSKFHMVRSFRRRGTTLKCFITYMLYKMHSTFHFISFHFIDWNRIFKKREKNAIKCAAAKKGNRVLDFVQEMYTNMIKSFICGEREKRKGKDIWSWRKGITQCAVGYLVGEKRIQKWLLFNRFI